MNFYQYKYKDNYFWNSTYFQAIDFPTQLEQFNTVVSSLTAELGDTEARELIANAVYFISIGSNDYLCYLGSPKMQEVFTPEDIVGMVIGNLSEAIQVSINCIIFLLQP